MKNYSIKVTTSLRSYVQTYTANDMTHAQKLTQTLFFTEGDYFIYVQEKGKSIHVPRHAVLEITVQELECKEK